jgi:hypothetical protein
MSGSSPCAQSDESEPRVREASMGVSQGENLCGRDAQGVGDDLYANWMRG